jgi:hypothetical protein
MIAEGRGVNGQWRGVEASDLDVLRALPARKPELHHKNRFAEHRYHRIKEQPTITWVVNVEQRKAMQGGADGVSDRAVV